jgi:GT2 family glycosyltransferase
MTANAIDIVIPVYRNLDLTRRCVESVRRAADPVMGTIYVINDASPEPELADYCDAIGAHEGVLLITHASNQGFVRSVNEGFAAAGQRDVVILNSDTEVPVNWLTRLRTAADREPKAASITPFSNNATICSYPHFCEDNQIPEGFDCDDFDTLFSGANAECTIEIPTAVGFCMYVRRGALDEVGKFDAGAFGRGYGEENDWCLRATAKGWKHLLAADVFVYHAGGASFGSDASEYQANALKVISERYPNYNRDIAQFVEADPIEVARYNVDTVRSDTKAVIDEYRRRERNLRQSRYALDRQRHEQVVALDKLLQSTREEAIAEARRYEALLTSQRQDTAASEIEYHRQINEMAVGCASLERELQTLQRFWPVRLRNWLKRRFGQR